MIKTLGLASIGLAQLPVPSTDAHCYPYATDINTLCTGIATTYAVSGVPVTRCAAEASAALGAIDIKHVCGIFTHDCLTKYCCGGPSGSSCPYFGPGSDPNSQCNSANWLIDYVYFGNSTNAANPPASTTTNRCYGNMPGQSIIPAGTTSCTISTTVTDAAGNTRTETVAGYAVGGVCYPLGTGYIGGLPYVNYGYMYPMDYYWYGNPVYGMYYDFYGVGYNGLYYPYYGMYGVNGIYDNSWYNSGYWGYGMYDIYYWPGQYGFWGMLKGTRYQSVDQFKKEKLAEQETEHKQLAAIRSGDVLELNFSPKLFPKQTLTQISK